jgi:hypothetical protein
MRDQKFRFFDRRTPAHGPSCNLFADQPLDLFYCQKENNQAKQTIFEGSILQTFSFLVILLVVHITVFAFSCATGRSASIRATTSFVFRGTLYTYRLDKSDSPLFSLTYLFIDHFKQFQA